MRPHPTTIRPGTHSSTSRAPPAAICARWRRGDERGAAPSDTLTAPRDGWLRNGLLAGLVATGGMTIALVVAYVAADGVGDPRGGVVARWLWALAHNRVTEAVGGGPLLFIGLQLSVGLALSALY